MKLENLPEFLALHVRRILNLEIAALCDHHLRRELTVGITPTGFFPPFLDGLDFVPVLLVLHFNFAQIRRHHGHDARAKFVDSQSGEFQNISEEGYPHHRAHGNIDKNKLDQRKSEQLL